MYVPSIAIRRNLRFLLLSGHQCCAYFDVFAVRKIRVWKAMEATEPAKAAEAEAVAGFQLQAKSITCQINLRVCCGGHNSSGLNIGKSKINNNSSGKQTVTLCLREEDGSRASLTKKSSSRRLATCSLWVYACAVFVCVWVSCVICDPKAKGYSSAQVVVPFTVERTLALRVFVV